MADVMNSELYKPNSHKAKAEEEKKKNRPKANKIVTGSVKSKETSMVKKAARNMLAEDMSNVKSYIILDVLIPTIKEAISQIIKNGSDMLIFGDVRPSGKKTVGFNYNGISKKSNSTISGNRTYTVNRRATHDFRDVTFETRSDAMEVLSNMNELIEDYTSCTVEDFYNFIGEGDNAKFTDRKYGWTNLEGVGIERVIGGGYSINLPKAEELD